ncbi:MAG: CAP domain-containing protein [Nocardioides sp.]
MRTSALAVTLLTVSLALPAAAAQARPAHDHVNDRVASASPKAKTVHMRSRAWAAKVVELTNDRRRAHGVKPLKAARCPRHFAAPWARHMARTQTMVHHSSLSPLFRCGRSPSTAGENIAEGFETPGALVRAWMSDKGHRDNLLDPAFKRIGVAGARLGHGWTFAIQDFVG